MKDSECSSPGTKIGELSLKIPVIQGGMGVGISLSRLAGSVAACGGIGIISSAQIGYQDPEFQKDPMNTNLRVLGEEIKKAKELANGGIIGVNIMVATKHYDLYVKAAAKAGADVIISGAGLPVDLPAYVLDTKVKIAPIVSSVKAASVICKLWKRRYDKIPDFIVIEGPKAGGHLGFTKEQLQYYEEHSYEEEISNIIAFVRNYESEVNQKIPVFTAGGIFSGADLKRQLALGADGVQVGTRFVTTYECDADERYKQAYIQAKKEDIRIVNSPVGMPGRAIYNEFMEQTNAGKIPVKACFQCLEHCNPAETPYCITEALITAAKGEIHNGLLFCGENAWKNKKLEHVLDIMKEFANLSEYEV